MLSAEEIGALVAELAGPLAGSRIEKVRLRDPLTVVLSLRPPRGPHSLPGQPAAPPPGAPPPDAPETAPARAGRGERRGAGRQPPAASSRLHLLLSARPGRERFHLIEDPGAITGAVAPSLRAIAPPGQGGG